jgi:hypothetical protein
MPYRNTQDGAPNALDESDALDVASHSLKLVSEACARLAEHMYGLKITLMQLKDICETQEVTLRVLSTMSSLPTNETAATAEDLYLRETSAPSTSNAEEQQSDT